MINYRFPNTPNTKDFTLGLNEDIEIFSSEDESSIFLNSEIEKNINKSKDLETLSYKLNTNTTFAFYFAEIDYFSNSFVTSNQHTIADLNTLNFFNSYIKIELYDSFIRNEQNLINSTIIPSYEFQSIEESGINAYYPVLKFGSSNKYNSFDIPFYVKNDIITKLYGRITYHNANTGNIVRFTPNRYDDSLIRQNTVAPRFFPNVDRISNYNSKIDYFEVDLNHSNQSCTFTVTPFFIKIFTNVLIPETNFFQTLVFHQTFYLT